MNVGRMIADTDKNRKVEDKIRDAIKSCKKFFGKVSIVFVNPADAAIKEVDGIVVEARNNIPKFHYYAVVENKGESLAKLSGV